MSTDNYNPYKDTLQDIEKKDVRSWIQYFAYKEVLAKNNINVVLVDMVWHPVEWSILSTDDLFFQQQHPEGTYFALYCDSGCSISGYTKSKLTPLLPQYRFVDISSGAGMYHIEQMNAEFFKTNISIHE